MNLIKGLIAFHKDFTSDSLGWIMLCLLIIAELAVSLIVFIGFYCIFDAAYYIRGYEAATPNKGEVVDMDYTPRQSNYNPIIKTIQTTSEKNQVTIHLDGGSTFTLDSSELYQRVRIDDKVTVYRQKIFKRPRYSSGEWVFEDYRLIKIVTYKDKTVEFDDEQPVLKRDSL